MKLQKDDFFLFFLILFFHSSCEKAVVKNRGDFDSKDMYIEEKFSNYSKLYTSVNDSIKSWIEDSLAVSKTCFLYSYKVDSIFIFNNSKDCFYTTINIDDASDRHSNAGLIEAFAGRKINGKWYFFFGASTILQREYYQYSKYSPFSFEEMSYLAYEQKFSYSIENNKPLPEEAMDDFFGGGMVNYLGIKGRRNINRYIDSMALVTNASYHAKKMTKEEIAEIQKAIDESVRPPEPQKETKQWWQFWKDEPQTPIFETEEWKNYLKQKYGSKWQEHL